MPQSLLFKKITLAFSNIVVALALAWLANDYPKRFDLGIGANIIIFILTSFLISAFSIGNAYRFSKKYEAKQPTKKQILFYFFSVWSVCFLCMMFTIIRKIL